MYTGVQLTRWTSEKDPWIYYLNGNQVCAYIYQMLKPTDHFDDKGNPRWTVTSEK